jgi:hypothetical protein
MYCRKAIFTCDINIFIFALNATFFTFLKSLNSILLEHIKIIFNARKSYKKITLFYARTFSTALIS